MVDKDLRRPKTVVIIYEQPKVIIVRKYTQTIIRNVNPDDYRQRYNTVLLDTDKLLEITRHLNIQENMITPPKYTH